MIRATSLTLILVSFVIPGTSQSAPREIVVTSPAAHEVKQRSGFQCQHAHSHSTARWPLGFAALAVEGKLDGSAVDQVEIEIRRMDQADQIILPWFRIPVRWKGETFRSDDFRVPAGGWYQVGVRIQNEGMVTAAGTSGPFGIGEVFVVAGQSYAAGANDAILKISEQDRRASALDLATGKWQIADDPQPFVGDGGTIWPALANALLPIAQVPIGFVNVAVGATSSRQWLPGTPLFERLIQAGKSVGSFRAVLWQQGESDVIERVTTAKYRANLMEIERAAAKAWGREPTWLLAKSTLHPTVYNEPAAEQEIREAIDQLWKQPGFAPGPDTDILDGPNRGGPDTRRHFSAIGQENAGRMWSAMVWNEILRQCDSEARELTFMIRRTPKGNRYGISGETREAPCVVVLGLGIEDMQKNPRLTEVGRRLMPDGFVVVTLDPPCHADDQRQGEPPMLDGWRYRLDRNEDIVADFVARGSDVLDHLFETKAINSQIVVCGTSRGGFLALHWARLDARVAAAVGFSPVTDLCILRECAGSQEGSLASQLKLQASASDFANKALWVTIGNRDERVGTQSTMDLITAVLKNATATGSDRPLMISLEIAPSMGHSTPAGAHERAATWIRSLPLPGVP
jgi:alpha-beta hydrolase superfamily lysophospholipase